MGGATSSSSAASVGVGVGVTVAAVALVVIVGLVDRQRHEFGVPVSKYFPTMEI